MKSPARSKVWPASLLVLAVGLLAFAVIQRSDISGGQVVQVSAGEQAAERIDIDAETVTGEPISLAELRGRPVIINVWASW
jgi:hypothetical protein